MKIFAVFLVASVLAIYVGCQVSNPALDLSDGVRDEPGAITDATIYSEANVDMKSMPIAGILERAGRVRYPESAKRDRIHADVLVSFIVDEIGCVIKATIAQGVDPLLDAEALRVVRSTRIVPAQVGGQPVVSLTTTTVGFRIR